MSSSSSAPPTKPPSERLRVLLVSLEAYRDQLDEYLTLVCDEGPFCEVGEPLPLPNTTTTTTTPPLLIRRKFIIILPLAQQQQQQQQESVTIEVDVLMVEPIQLDQLCATLDAVFLARYRGVTFCVSGNTDANRLMFDASTVQMRLAEELKDVWVAPLVKKIRANIRAMGGIDPILTLFAIDAEGKHMFGYDVYTYMRDLIASSDTFGQYTVERNEVVLLDQESNHLPWVLLARLILFDTSLTFDMPRSLAKAVAEWRAKNNNKKPTTTNLPPWDFSASSQGNLGNLGNSVNFDLEGGGGGGGGPGGLTPPPPKHWRDLHADDSGDDSIMPPGVDNYHYSPPPRHPANVRPARQGQGQGQGQGQQEDRSVSLVRDALKQIDKVLQKFEERVMTQFIIVNATLGKQNKRLKKIERLIQETGTTEGEAEEGEEEEEEEEGEEEENDQYF